MCSRSPTAFEAGLPVILSIKRMVEIHRGVIVCLRFGMAYLASEELAPLELDALTTKEREPLAPGTTARTVLACPMRVGLRSHDAQCIRFLAGTLSDLAAQQIGLFAVQASRLASRRSPDLAQALEHQHTPGIPGAHSGDGTRNPMGGVLVHALHMCPQLLVAVLAFHRLAREPLLLGNALEMAVACLIDALIPHKECLANGSPLPDGDDGEHLHVQIDRHRHQVGILLALGNLLSAGLPGLREVQFRCVLAQDQFGAVLFPGWIMQALLEVAVVLDGIVVPLPGRASVDFEPHKPRALLPIGEEIQLDRPLVKGRVIGSPRHSWFPPLLCALFPGGTMGEVGPRLANGFFNGGSPVDHGHPSKALAKVPALPRMRVLAGGHGASFCPGQQLVGGNRARAQLQMLFRVVLHALCQFVGVGQKEGEVESTRLSEYRSRGFQVRAFAGIGASLFAFAHIEREPGRACGLTHRVFPYPDRCSIDREFTAFGYICQCF